MMSTFIVTNIQLIYRERTMQKFLKRHQRLRMRPFCRHWPSVWPFCTAQVKIRHLQNFHAGTVPSMHRLQQQVHIPSIQRNLHLHPPQTELKYERFHSKGMKPLKSTFSFCFLNIYKRWHLEAEKEIIFNVKQSLTTRLFMVSLRVCMVSNVLNSCSRHTISIRSIILMRVIDTAARRPYMVVMIIEIQCFQPGLEGFQRSP